MVSEAQVEEKQGKARTYRRHGKGLTLGAYIRIGMGKTRKEKSKGAIGICAECGEAYPLKHGHVCIQCQKGQSYYRKVTDGTLPEHEDPGLRKVPLSEAVGLPLAHDVTRIEPGKFKGPEFSRGHEVRAGELCRLHQMVKNHLYVMDNVTDDYLHEDEAIRKMAVHIGDDGTKYSKEPREVKKDFCASHDGLFLVNTDQLPRFNLIPEVMCAARHRYTLVKEGERVGGARAIPLLISLEKVSEAAEIEPETEGLFSVRRLRDANEGILITGNEVFQGLIQDRFWPITSGKLDKLGSHAARTRIVPDDSDFIWKEALTWFARVVT